MSKILKHELFVKGRKKQAQKCYNQTSAPCIHYSNKQKNHLFRVVYYCGIFQNHQAKIMKMKRAHLYNIFPINFFVFASYPKQMKQNKTLKIFSINKIFFSFTYILLLLILCMWCQYVPQIYSVCVRPRLIIIMLCVK